MPECQHDAVPSALRSCYLTAIEDANAGLTLRLGQQALAVEFANFSLCNDDLQPVLDWACRVASVGM